LLALAQWRPWWWSRNRCERFNPEQQSLLDDEIEADLAAVASEIDALAPTPTAATPEKKQAKRLPVQTRHAQQTLHPA
jgi:hypothetical protein